MNLKSYTVQNDVSKLVALQKVVRKPLTNYEMKGYWVMTAKEINEYCLSHALKNLGTYSPSFIANYFEDLTDKDIRIISRELGEDKATKLFIKLLGKQTIKKLVNRLMKVDGKDSFIPCEGKAVKSRGLNNEMYYVYKMSMY